MSDASSWSPGDHETRALRVLERIRLFRGLPEDMLRQAAGMLREVHFPKGSRVFAQGRRMQEALYILLSGRVRVSEGEGEGRRILGYHGPGDVLGEIQLLTGGPALASAEALLDTVALTLPFRAFHDILESFPAAALPLARLLGRRLGAWSSRRGRRRTNVFLGLWAPRVGPAESLATLALAQALTRVTGSTVLVLDFDYGGPIPKGRGPGVLRAIEEVLDAHGKVAKELLRQRILHADKQLSYLLLHLAPADLEQVPPEVFPALLGEAKALASYVLVRVPAQVGRGATKLLEQLEQVVVPLRPADLEGGGARELLRKLPAPSLMAGFLGREGEAIPTRKAFREAAGRDPAFVLPCPEVAVRSIQRLTPYPREAFHEGEPGALQARRVVRTLTRRRLGLCLGSGTALGWAHIGVLRVLLGEGIPVDCVAGSSMGSIIASMLASGMSPAEMAAHACSVTQEVVDGWADYNWPMMRDGLVRGDLIVSFLEGIFGDTRIEDCALPLVIQATDLVSGAPYFFREGRIVDALRASTSLPGIFRPVHAEERVLVDGGVHDTLPTGPLRDLGADLVLAVNTTQSPSFSELSAEAVRGYNVFDLFMRSLEIMQSQRTRFEGASADLVLQPSFRGPTWKELWRAEEIIAFGEEVAERNLDRVQGLLRSPPP